jgi:hypothetical protein
MIIEISTLNDNDLTYNNKLLKKIEKLLNKNNIEYVGIDLKY